MSTLTVTSRDQVTFRKDLLQHLGIAPGDRLQMDMMPNGGVLLKAVRPSGHISDIFGLLADKTDKVATIEEINEAIEKGWAGER